MCGCKNEKKSIARKRMRERRDHQSCEDRTSFVGQECIEIVSSRVHTNFMQTCF